MHRQTLKNLVEYHRDATFEQFCQEIFPDFDPVESSGYLHEKFELFQNRFMLFLSELDELHFDKVALSILKHYGNAEPVFLDIIARVGKIHPSDTDADTNALEMLRLDICPMILDYQRKIKQMRNVLAQLVNIITGKKMKDERKKHYYTVWGGTIIGTGMLTEEEAKNFNANPENKKKQLWVVENVPANLSINTGSRSHGH